MHLFDPCGAPIGAEICPRGVPTEKFENKGVKMTERRLAHLNSLRFHISTR